MQFFLSQSIPDNAFHKIGISYSDLAGLEMETNHIQNILHDLLVKVHYFSKRKVGCKNKVIPEQKLEIDYLFHLS